LIMAKKKNPRLEPEEIERRLIALNDGYASNAIEGNPLLQAEKTFLEGLVSQGLTEDEMSKKIDKEFHFG
jgi:Fic family protein